MSTGDLGRIQSDLAVMRQAMGLQPSFGKGMLLFGSLLTLAAGGSAVVCLLVESLWLQIVPFATLMTVCLLGLYVYSRRTADLGHEIKLQVGFHVATYFAAIGAAGGYTLAVFCGPSIGVARTAALHACSLAYIVVFSVILVLNAVRFRDRYYGFGLATALLLTGLIVPICSAHYTLPLTYGFLAIGYLIGVAIQSLQLRDAETRHAAD